MVEVARLESVYRFIAYRGFESPSLRQEQGLCSARLSKNPRISLRERGFFIQSNITSHQGASKNRRERRRYCAKTRSNARAKRGSQAQEMPAQ